MDFSTLKLLSDTHIDKRLKATFSDTIHECMLNVEKISADIKDREKLTKFRFCFLWEHKSSKPSEPIEFQVDDYRKSIIRADLKNKRPPSIVLPFLLYHGKDKWSNKLIYDQMSPYLPDEIMSIVPHPKYIIIDLQAISDEVIEQITDLGTLRAVFIALKHGHDKDFFRKNAKNILKFVDELSSQYLFDETIRMILEYMQRRSELQKEDFDDIINNEIEPEMTTRVQTIFEYAEEQGKAQGMQQGMQQGIAIAKATLETSIEFCIQVTGLADEQIAAGLNTEVELVKSIRKGLATKKAVKSLMQSTDKTDRQIADELQIEYDLVKTIRADLTQES